MLLNQLAIMLHINSWEQGLLAAAVLWLADTCLQTRCAPRLPCLPRSCTAPVVLWLASPVAPLGLAPPRSPAAAPAQHPRTCTHTHPPARPPSLATAVAASWLQALPV